MCITLINYQKPYTLINIQLVSKNRICSTRQCDSLEVVRKQYIFIAMEALQELQHFILYILSILSNFHVYSLTVFGSMNPMPQRPTFFISQIFILHNTTEKNIVRIITGNDRLTSTTASLRLELQKKITYRQYKLMMDLSSAS